MLHPYEVITTFLRGEHVSFEEINHEPVHTSEEAAYVNGLPLSAGAKSLLLYADKQFVLLILPGNTRLDSRKVKALFGIKQLRFATPSEVKEIMGCSIGACYPFGNLIGITMIVDPKLANNDVISFNPGIHNKSIKISWKDFEKAVNPRLQNISVDVIS